ncbi:PAS domain-containing sensor histidine kinase [Methanolobus profundi]|uniref:histidine kinase n=1 Tax=Methanolobus profundi TaxID=487685 RepID=A0A1I4PI16_9EURY|nr:PAS domain-containing sensor histidine kinase [Methanolobus profundi]SFM27481.1 PAS domain S-box-containing protein [Methanolobus profundi]
MIDKNMTDDPDVSDRSDHLKRELFQKTALLSGLLRSVPDLVFFKDTDGVFLSCNEMFAQCIGKPVSEIIGQTSHDLFDRNRADFFRSNDKRVLETGQSSKSVEWIDCASGDRILLETYKTPILTEENELIGVVGVGRDITERKHAEDELQDKKNELFQIVNGSPIPAFVINKDHNIIYWNRACEKATGIKAHEVIGTRDSWMAFYKEERPVLADLVVDNSLENIDKLYENNKLTPSFVEGGYQAEAFFPLLNKWILLTAAPIRDHNNDIMGAIETLQDITISKQAEKAILDAKMLAENTSRTKSEFLCNMNHELRTPLNLILGYADLLLAQETGQLNEEQKHFTEIIKFAGSRFLDLVDSLIYIAEIEEGKMELDIEMFSLPAMMSDVKRMLGPNAFKKGVKLEFDIDTHVSVVYADKSKIKTMLHHLISNGIKFTPAGGTVSVIVRQNESNDLHMIVKDNGIGISEEDQKRLYNAFVQLDGSLNRKFEGTGLGLSIVKKFVEVHGGHIDLESDPGKGSTFEVILPLSDQEPDNSMNSICDYSSFPGEH